MTYDCTRDALVGASTSTDEVFTIDYSTGIAHSFIQTTIPLEGNFGIEYDVTTNSVLLSSGFEMYAVHVGTGSTSLVGTITGAVATPITNLAFHPECP